LRSKIKTRNQMRFSNTFLMFRCAKASSTKDAGCCIKKMHSNTLNSTKIFSKMEKKHLFQNYSGQLHLIPQKHHRTQFQKKSTWMRLFIVNLFKWKRTLISSRIILSTRLGFSRIPLLNLKMQSNSLQKQQFLKMYGR